MSLNVALEYMAHLQLPGLLSHVSETRPERVKNKVLWASVPALSGVRDLGGDSRAQVTQCFSSTGRVVTDFCWSRLLTGGLSAPQYHSCFHHTTSVPTV